MRSPMFDPRSPLAFFAHPGHELLIHGWVQQTKPRVCVLTDGSGPSLTSRLESTEEVLRAIGASPGGIFGRLTDLEAYAAILDGDAALFTSIAEELAQDLAGISVVVADACEGYNPVHDLCRLIAGSACSVAGVPYYESPVAHAPSSFADARIELDEQAFRDKMTAARAYSRLRGDMDDHLARYGEDAFRVETFRRVDDWTAIGWSAGEKPYYETFGEQRVAAGRYERAIRYEEHMRPLCDAFRAWAGACRCAS